MTELHISGLLLDQIVHRIQTSMKHGADRWAAIVARTAGVHQDADEDGIIRQLDCWVADTSEEMLKRSLCALQSANERTCDPRVVKAMIEMGCNPFALYVLSAVCDSSVGVDRGEFDNGQFYLLPDRDDHDELAIPLTPSIYWCGGRMLVRKGLLPDTVVDALMGKPANTIINHTLLAESTITGQGKDQGDFLSLLLDISPRTEWTFSYKIEMT